MLLDDEDEFQKGLELGYISEDERQASLAAAADLQRRLRTNDPLFDELAWFGLAEATALGLPPIVDVV